MNRDEILKYVKETYGTSPEYLWSKYPEYAVLRHNNNKWYAVIMNVPKDKLNIEDSQETVDILDIKCPPEMIGSFRKEKGFLPAYHMNKEHWITIVLNGSVDNMTITKLIDLSYEITENKR